MASVLTPLQLNAGAGLLQNQGLAVNAELTAAKTAYESTAVMAPLLATIQGGVAGGLSAPTITALNTMAANTVPALADNVPTGYASITVNSATPGFTGAIGQRAILEMGSGDLTVFVQGFNAAQSFGNQTSDFINSAVNSQTYLGDTFSGMNNMITGDITTVNLATPAWGQDLARLGQLIDLNNLGNLGTPLALIQRTVQITGNIPVLSFLLLSQGVSQDIVLNLSDPAISVTDTVQRLMYQAMTQITGDELSQILQTLGVTTANINTMADLLDPVKLFPNSFASLTVTTAQGPRAIYVNESGSVNELLLQELPTSVIGLQI